MFRFRIAISVVAVLSFPLLAAAQGGSSASAGSGTLSLPAWLAPFPSARDEHHSGTADIDSTYRASRPPGEVTEYYREQLEKAEIHFNVSFDGIGTAIRCSEGKSYCLIQIREIDEGTSVRVSYSPTAGSSVGVVGASEPVKESLPVVSAPPPSPKAAESSNHQIEYIIEGTAGVAGLTYRNAGGGTEQNDVVLPATVRFTTVTGAFAYISAQKKGREGIVRVSIKVDGILTRQSTSSAPFGIASASGRVVDRKIIY